MLALVQPGKPFHLRNCKYFSEKMRVLNKVVIIYVNSSSKSDPTKHFLSPVNTIYIVEKPARVQSILKQNFIIIPWFKTLTNAVALNDSFADLATTASSPSWTNCCSDNAAGDLDISAIISGAWNTLHNFRWKREQNSNIIKIVILKLWLLTDDKSNCLTVNFFLSQSILLDKIIFTSSKFV